MGIHGLRPSKSWLRFVFEIAIAVLVIAWPLRGVVGVSARARSGESEGDQFKKQRSMALQNILRVVATPSNDQDLSSLVTLIAG